MALKIGKLSLEQILQGINELSEEDKAKVSEMLNGAPEETAPVEEETETVEMTEETPEENVEEVEGETEEFAEAPQEEVEEVSEETAPVENVDVAEDVNAMDEMADAPMETPESTATEETAAPNNYDELIAAQTARIDSLESALSTLMERMEQIVSNYDNQNFGYSPNNYQDEDNSSRMNAVMQGYAPRRAGQYR